jgi:hypothetical protein
LASGDLGNFSEKGLTGAFIQMRVAEGDFDSPHDYFRVSSKETGNLK